MIIRATATHGMIDESADMYESGISLQVPQRFREDEIGEDAMKHHLVQSFKEPNLITMPGTQRPLYAQPGTIELVTLEKMSGAAKVRRLEHTRTKYKEFQISIFNILERPRSAISILYHSLVFILILGSLFMSVILTIKEFEKDKDILDATYFLEISLVIVFVLEYILRVWSCSCHGNYTGFWGKLRFIKRPYMVIDIIVIVATVVVVATTDDSNKSNYFSVSVFRFLRFLQVLRILRLDRQRGAFKIVSHVVYEHRQELLTCWYMSFILLVACSFLVYLAEKSDDDPENGSQMKDLGEGMYFAAITLLTIGYGDFSPQNWVAKLLTCLFAFVGTAFFALPAGILGSGFALQVAQNQKQKHFNRRRYPAALVIQYAWRSFAAHPRHDSIATWLQHQVLALPKEKKYSIYAQSPATTPTGGRKMSYLRKKFQPNHKYSYTDGDGFHSRRSSIGATIPSALELRDRCQSDGNLLLVSPHNVEENQATIVSLPPDYADSLNAGKNPYGLTGHFSNQDIQFRPLTDAEKNAIRFIRKIKFRVAIKKFKEECRPYDVKDVIEKYTEGQIEMFGFIKRLQSRLETSLGVTDSESIDPRTTIHTRLNAVEDKVYTIDAKLDQVILLLSERHHHSHHHHHRHNQGGGTNESASAASINLIGSSTESIFGDRTQNEQDTIGDGSSLNPIENQGVVPSPRDRKRGMTFEADELSRRLERLRYESTDTSMNTSDNELRVPSSERRGSRFTVTPTVIDLKLTDVDVSFHENSGKSSRSSLNSQKVAQEDSKQGCNSNRSSIRSNKCASCASKSLNSLADKSNTETNFKKFASDSAIPLYKHNLSSSSIESVNSNSSNSLQTSVNTSSMDGPSSRSSVNTSIKNNPSLKSSVDTSSKNVPLLESSANKSSKDDFQSLSLNKLFSAQKEDYQAEEEIEPRFPDKDNEGIAMNGRIHNGDRDEVTTETRTDDENLVSITSFEMNC